MGRFDQEAAVHVAAERVEEVVAERHEQLRGEAEAAKIAAASYAEHLADGGDPTRTPEGTGGHFRNRSAIMSDLTGIVAVYRLWNLARESMNPILPFQNATRWRVAERLLEDVGQPVLYAELAAIGRAGNFGTRISSDEVQRAMREVENGLDGALVARKTKVEGKVAYYFRRRQEGDGAHEGDVRGDVPEEALA